MSVNMINVEDIVRTQGNKIVTNIKNSSGTIIWPYGKKYDLSILTTSSNSVAGDCHIEYRSHNVGDDCKVNDGDEFTVVATPKGNYSFRRWEVGGVDISHSSRLVQIADRETNYVAYFGNMMTITLVTEGTGNATGGGPFWKGDACTLTATETTTGWRFVGWYNGPYLISEDKVFSFTVTASITVRAVFSNEYTITTTNNGNGTTTGGTATYNSTLTIGAFPNTNYVFSHWTHDDAYVTFNRNYTVTVTKDDSYKGWFCASGNAFVKVSNMNPEVITTYSWANVSDSSKSGSLSIGLNEITRGNTRISFRYNSSKMPAGSSCRITFTDKFGNITRYTASSSTTYNITGYTEITFDVYMPA